MIVIDPLGEGKRQLPNNGAPMTLPGPRGGAGDERDPPCGSTYRLGAAGLYWETTCGLDSLR